MSTGINLDELEPLDSERLPEISPKNSSMFFHLLKFGDKSLVGS